MKETEKHSKPQRWGQGRRQISNLDDNSRSLQLHHIQSDLEVQSGNSLVLKERDHEREDPNGDRRIDVTDFSAQGRELILPAKEDVDGQNER